MATNPVVLVVDGDNSVRDHLYEIFLSTGYGVQLADSVLQALEKIRTGQLSPLPDVVVLGQKYTEQDRANFLRTLQKELETTGKNISVLVFSTFSVNLPQSSGGTRAMTACLLGSVAKLLTLVRGLTKERRTAVANAALN